MKTFHCDSCDGVLFFENVVCMNCHKAVAYLPEQGIMATLEGKDYKLCQNYVVENVCNWAVANGDAHDFCLSCRLTQVIPDLTQAGNREAWYRMENAKRRTIYGVQRLGLPVVSKVVDPVGGLAFEFKSDLGQPAGEPVLTGHDDGLITLNIAEADDAEREKRRLNLHEPYRTLLGHFRHEVGHYYWDRLIRDSDNLGAYRELFGDESADYAEALQRHYGSGAPADWQDHYVSTYATSHPWEDWAETWAHYMHMMDSLETAAACGLSLRPEHSAEPALKAVAADPTRERFDTLNRNWLALTYALNNLNRSMGLQDAYPFVLPDPALAKLRFVHDIVTAAAQSGQGAPVSAPVSRVA